MKKKQTNEVGTGFFVLFWPFSSCCYKLNAQPKKPRRNRRILRFSSSVWHVVFRLLYFHSWFPLSLSLLQTDNQKCFQITFHIIWFAFYCRKSRISSFFSGSSCWQVKPAKKKPKLSAFSDFYMPRRGCRLSAYAQRHKSLGVATVKLQHESVRGLIKNII